TRRSGPPRPALPTCRPSTAPRTAPATATGPSPTARTPAPARGRAPTRTPTCSWAPFPRRRPRRPRRRRLLPRRLRRRRRQRQPRPCFTDDQPAGGQRVLDEAADLAGEEEAHVAARVPLHAGTVPVLPEQTRLSRSRHAVADAGEKETTITRGLGFEHERRHHAVHLDRPGPEGARLERLAPHLHGAVAPIEVDEVGGGNAGDHTRKVVLERRGQRRGVPAEGEAVEPDVGLGLVESDPADRRSDVPRRLREAVDGVDEVDRHEPLAAVGAGLLTGAVQRQ